MNEGFGAQIKGIVDCGPPDHPALSAARLPIITAKQLQRFVGSIPALKQQGFLNLAIVGNAGAPFPPNSLKFAVALLRLDDSRRIGLLRWEKGRNLVFRLEALEVVASSSCTSEMTLHSVSSSLQSFGWQDLVIDFSTSTCAPFFSNEPQVNELTAIATAISMDDIAEAKKRVSEAYGYMQRQAWREAAQAFKHATELNPADADAWASYAGAQMGNGDVDGALSCCDTALFINSKHGGAWLNKGICLYNGKRSIHEARKCFVEAERMGVDSAADAIRQLDGRRV